MHCFPCVDTAVFRDLDELMNKGRGTTPFFSAVSLEVMQIWRGQLRYHGHMLIMIRSQLLKRGLCGAKIQSPWSDEWLHLASCPSLFQFPFSLSPYLNSVHHPGVWVRSSLPRFHTFSFPPGLGLRMESCMCERGGQMMRSAWKKKSVEISFA